jgi:CheY-like chemotaxis protein
MMTDIELSFIDGANLELLFNNLIADTRLEKKNIKVLSLKDFVKQLINGHPQYAGIEVADSIASVMGYLVGEIDDGDVDIVTSRILSASEEADLGSVEMRFESETTGAVSKETLENVRIALVDDEAAVRQMLDDIFKNTKANVSQYVDGLAFLEAAKTMIFDIVVLDIVMPRLNGINVLKVLAQSRYAGKVLVYSKVTQREVVTQSMQLGAKGYMVKPQPPEVILKKVTQILEPRVV